MYPKTLQTLYFVDAQRLLELHHFHRLMEKHHHVCQKDTYEPIRRLAMEEHVRRSPGKPLTSFKISDILSAENGDSTPSTQKTQTASTNQNNGTTLFQERISSANLDNNQRLKSTRSVYHTIQHRTSPSVNRRIIRPWSRSPPLTSPSSDEGSEKSSRHSHVKNKLLTHSIFSPHNDHIRVLDDDEFIDVEHCDDDDGDDDDDDDCDTDCSEQVAERDVSPLDALMAMSSKTFQGLDDFDKRRRGDQDPGKSHVPKKKRKTRTAFTNQQIYELEKRFIMQKYLTPADRDEISAKLGLSSAQVITWFQNRRAKFKRDIEEMKNDVCAVSPKPQERREDDVI